jgi:hypothetical protein
LSLLGLVFNILSLNGDFLNKQKIWVFNSVAFKIRKKRIPLKLKPTPLKNWKNKWKVHLNLKENPYKKRLKWILK